MRLMSLFLIVGLSFFSCKKDVITVKFNLNYDTRFIVESGNLIDVPFSIFTPEVTTNSQAEFEAKDTRKDKIEEIRLNFLNLIILDPPSQTFSFLKHIYIYMNADGLEEILLASRENIDDNTQELNLIVEDQNFAEYIKKDGFTLRVKTVTDQVLGQDVEIEADMQFAVRAKVL